MRYFLKVLLLLLFSSYSVANVLQIATSNNLKLLNVDYQHLLEVAITNAGFQVNFVEFDTANTLTKSNLGQLDGELYRYSYTMRQYDNLSMIPIKLNSSALFVYVPQKKECPDFQTLTEYTPVGVTGIAYFDDLYASSLAGFIEQDSVTRAIESLMKTPLSYTVFPEDIAPSLMQLTGAKLKRCYQQPLLVLSAYSYLHKKHADKIGAISRELNTLLLTQ
ncbi:hypothetical protein [Psychromonas sp. Urea-02u-13]|uniref:hypothetical protein n=1 Tax=Psychromonas sp. Urea-02u-13 TaxID=2058326 RepID=UPI000C332C28|nr:hypothetical protein [Psychromonas sp. Urea-02u-13]PKG40825.1 hypothetical protein CXF74_01415 [Psychromonas sp. Urea-02u-13]